MCATAKDSRSAIRSILRRYCKRAHSTTSIGCATTGSRSFTVAFRGETAKRLRRAKNARSRRDVREGEAARMLVRCTSASTLLLLRRFWGTVGSMDFFRERE